MSNAVRTTRASLSAFAVATALAAPAAAQSTSEYAQRVDSLARIWRSTVVHTHDTTQANAIPRDSLRVGPIIVRADSQWTDLGRATAERLAPVVTQAYGKFAERLAGHQFVLRDKGGWSAGGSVLSSVRDSTGALRLHGSDFPNTEALLNSWERKVELVIAGEMGDGVRSWLATSIPLDPPTNKTWSDARISLALTQTPAAAMCVRGDMERCSQILGITPVDDPAFVLFDSASRLNLIKANATILRRADARQFDRCAVTKIQSACDSLARSIPPDAVPAPVSPMVRQSFVRFALATGGDGAFDRFTGGATPRARIEAAAQLPADSVIKLWHATITDSRSSSTAIDFETGMSALAWAAVCGALALRSSRWR